MRTSLAILTGSVAGAVVMWVAVQGVLKPQSTAPTVSQPASMPSQATVGPGSAPDFRLGGGPGPGPDPAPGASAGPGPVPDGRIILSNIPASGDARATPVDAEFGAVARIVLQASEDPDAALDALFAMDSGLLRMRAMSAAAESLAGSDPRALLDRIEAIGDPGMMREMANPVLIVWARQDALAALRYIDTVWRPRYEMRMADGRTTNAGPGVAGAVMARMDPHELLAFAPELSTGLARSARITALRRIAADDPAAAADYLRNGDLPAADQNIHVHAVAGPFAARDPDGALAWAREFGGPVAEQVVMQNIAATDPDRVIARISELSGNTSLIANLIFPMVQNQPQRMPELATALMNELAVAPDQYALNVLGTVWAQQDPRAALEWVLANASVLRAPAFVGVATGLVARPDLATRAAGQVPAHVRTDWLTAFSQAYASMDPARAASWVTRFEGDPAYAASAAVIATQLARIDPPAAAQLLAAVPADEASQAVMAVALGWAGTDRPAALQWVGTLSDPVRQTAFRNIFANWANEDVNGAHDWLVTHYPPGPLRDDALHAVVRAALNSGAPDPQLINGFSTPAARDNAAFTVVQHLRMRDNATARVFMNRFITDPDILARAERLLEQTHADQAATGGFFRGTNTD